MNPIKKIKTAQKKIKKTAQTVAEALSPRGKTKEEGFAFAEQELLGMDKPPLSEPLKRALMNSGYGELLDGALNPHWSGPALGEISRLFVRNRAGEALAWLYLHLQRDRVGGGRTLCLGTPPITLYYQPRQDTRLHGEDIQFIGRWLLAYRDGLPDMTDIDLSGHAVDETGLNQLGEMLTGIVRLDLSGNSFIESKVKPSFYEATRNALALKELNLSVRGLDWGQLCNALKSLSLNTLKISMDVEPTGHQSDVWRHCHVLLSNPHLLHLDLSGHRLSEAPTELTNALQNNKSLKTLILRGCIGWTKHCLDFISAIGSHPGLRVVNLSGISLHLNTTQIAGALLSKQTRLVEIDLSRIESPLFGTSPVVEEQHYTRLFEFLKGNQSLRRLALQGHPLDEKTQEKLAEALKDSRLRMLDIRGCGFSAEMVKAAVLNSRSLIEVQASDLGDGEEAQAIQHKLAENELLRDPMFRSAAEGLQGLSPVELPTDLANEILAWAREVPGERNNVRHLAMAGFEPSQKPFENSGVPV